jgi:exportin-1
LKEFSGDELYLDDKELELEKKKKEEFEAALKIPGMVKPHDRPDDMME